MNQYNRDQSRPDTRWRWPLVLGLLLIIAGIFALAHPVAAGFVSGIMLGWMLLIFGALSVTAAWSALSGTARWVDIVLGTLAIIAAIVILSNPFAGALSLAFTIGLWLSMVGVLQIAFAVRTPSHRGWRLLVGVIDVLLGGYLLFASPLSGVLFIGTLLGISFLVRGLLFVLLGLALRNRS